MKITCLRKTCLIHFANASELQEDEFLFAIDELFILLSLLFEVNEMFILQKATL